MLTDDRLSREQLSPLARAASQWPGGGLHVATVHRFRKDGLRGVYLECVKNGGRWCTSSQAIDRFLKSLNARFAKAQPADDASKSADLISTEKALDRIGI